MASDRLTALRAQLAERQPPLVRLLEEAFDHALDIWVVMHEDLARVPRIRVTFDHLVRTLTDYCAARPPHSGASKSA